MRYNDEFAFYSMPYCYPHMYKETDLSCLVDLKKQLRYTGYNSDESEIDIVPSYIAGIRALRDYADWNLVWLVLVLFARILHDIDNFSRLYAEDRDALEQRKNIKIPFFVNM